MPVGDINQLEGHVCCTFHGIFVAAGRAETDMAAEWNKLEFSILGESVHGTAIRVVAAVNHLLNVFYLCGAGMEGIYYFFIMVGKYFLENVHGIIMMQIGAGNNPLMIEGERGS